MQTTRGPRTFRPNCAACTVAGLLGKTYSEVFLELGTSDAGCKMVETIFDHFYPDAVSHRREQFETFHPSKKQALGISAFLHKRGYHVAKVGGFDFHCPGQLPDPMFAMQQWSELPLLQRFGLPLAAPLFGLFMRHFGTRVEVAASLGMNLKKTRKESLTAQAFGETRRMIGDWRDRHLVEIIVRERAKAEGQEKNIGIVYGAAHMRAVLRYLLWDCDFKVVKSEWVTVFDL